MSAENQNPAETAKTTEEAEQARAEQQPDQSPEEIRADIEETRGELGDTVEALAHKADVKAQAQQKADEVKAQAQAKASDLGEQAKRNQTPITAGAGAVGALLLLIFILRRRKA